MPQKILNLNGCRSIPWPVHYTSKVFGDITTGRITTPGMSPGIYINGINGITFGENIYIGPGVKIISANHSESNYQVHVPGQPIRVGDNVWIGANAVILPEVNIGNNVIIGAGSVVTKNVPDDCIVGGNPAKEIRRKEAYRGERNES